MLDRVCSLHVVGVLYYGGLSALAVLKFAFENRQ